MLAGRLQPDAGRVTVRGGVRVGVLDQADALDDALTVERAVVGDAPEHVWAGDARARDVIRGPARRLPWDAPVGTLSGGQRRRVALAAPAHRRLGRPAARRADQPPRRRGDHLARRAPQAALGAAARAGCSSSPTTAGSSTRSAPPPGRSTTGSSSRSRAATPRTSCSGSSATGMAAASEAKRQNLARKELAWLRRGAPARTSKPQVPHRRRQRADRRRAGDPRPGLAAVARRRPARQGRRRPARRVGRLRRQPRA